MPNSTAQQAGESRTSTTGPAAPLPVQLTRLVGREREVAEVRRLIASTRLLTLTGAGGSGKTRLALEAAAQSAPSFEHGVAWVELAPLSDAEHLADHVASALGLRQEGSDAAEDVLVAALRERAMLLVLDNCEHVVDECARLVESLLRRCPRLHVLATSREALGVSGERSWLVPVLSLPDAAGGAAADEVARAAAVQLFVERAQDALPAFALTDANAGAVAHICRRVDGLPLAIELAAARVRVLPPEQIAARLDDGFRVLGGGARTALPRHRTLRAAIDWSVRLLEERERLLLERLSVFAGDWSLEAAEAVCADDELLPAFEILDLLGALVDKSLVVVREAAGTARYQLLETIREYAAELLQERGAGASASVRARHAAFYTALVARAEPLFITSRRREGVERAGRELDNVRAALLWTREHEPALHLRLAGMLTWLWYSVGLWAEGRRWLEGALALQAPDASRRDRAAALFGAGAFASLQAEPAVARAWLEESLALARESGDEALAAYASNYVAMSHIQLGQLDGEAYARSALVWFRAAGDLYGHRLALLLISTLRLSQGEVVAAREAAEEAVEVARRFGMDRELGIALQVLGSAVLVAGDFDRAEALVRESVRSLRGDPHPLFMGRAHDVLGQIAARRGDPLLAARLFGAAAAEREQIGASLWRTDRVRLAPVVEAAKAAAGAEAFDAAWAEGHRRGASILADQPAPALPPPIAAAPAPAPAPAAAVTQAPAAAALGAAPVRMRVLALGPLEVWRDGALLDAQAWRSARPRELLVFLLGFPSGRTREQIGLAFWPDASAAQVKNNFHVTLHHLRKVLGGAEWIVFEDGRYRINERLGVAFDAADFEREMVAALRGGARAAAARDAQERIARLRAVLALYRGDFLEGASAGDWHLDLCDRLRRLWLDGMLALGAALGEAEHYAEAAEIYQQVVSREELHEEAYRRLMTSHARAGDRLQAMRAYERLVRQLRADMDTEPEPATAALYERLRAAAPV